jgi:5,10-methylenetetrahydrofolate reductase
MKLREALKRLEQKFASGNDVPVTQTTITLEEWEALRGGLCKCKTKKRDDGPLAMLGL